MFGRKGRALLSTALAATCLFTSVRADAKEVSIQTSSPALPALIQLTGCRHRHWRRFGCVSWLWQGLETTGSPSRLFRHDLLLRCVRRALLFHCEHMLTSFTVCSERDRSKSSPTTVSCSPTLSTGLTCHPRRGQPYHALICRLLARNWCVSLTMSPEQGSPRAQASDSSVMRQRTRRLRTLPT